MSESRRLATTYHEAGHAVALVVLEYPFEFVTVVANVDEDRAGGVKFDPPKESDVRLTDRADKALTALYAGSVAEARFLDVGFEETWNSKYSFPDRVGPDGIGANSRSASVKR
jgi:ATP-dependent Zn protease